MRERERGAETAGRGSVKTCDCGQRKPRMWHKRWRHNSVYIEMETGRNSTSAKDKTTQWLDLVSTQRGSIVENERENN